MKTIDGTILHNDHQGDTKLSRLSNLPARIPIAGRLALISNLQHLTSRPAWDAAGNRITFQSSTRANDTDTYTFVYDPTAGVPAVIEEVTPAGTNRYIREPGGELVARVATVGTTETTSYYHFDELGSTQFLTSTDGVITDKYTYDAWGNLTSHTQQPYQYVGQIGYYIHTQDHNLRWIQTGVRCYDPLVGRYWSLDAAKQGGNWYVYVNAKPSRQTDPLGLWGTNDFVRWYYTGLGCPMDLAAVGLLAEYINAVDAETTPFEDKSVQLLLGKARNACKGKSGKVRVSYSNSEYVDTHVGQEDRSNNLYCIGSHRLYKRVLCVSEVDCCSKKIKYTCSFVYWFNDKFSDPFSCREAFGYEVNISLPYAITAEWTIFEKGNRQL